MEYEKYLNELENMLNKYYPIDNFSSIENILSSDDYKKYNEMVSKVTDTPIGRRKLENLQAFMSGEIPHLIKKEEQSNYNGNYDDSDDVKWKTSVTESVAKKAVDVCLYALENGNILQSIKCLNVIEKCRDNFKNKDGSYLWGGEWPDEKLAAYIETKVTDFSINKLNYKTAETDITFLIGDIVDKKIEELKQEIDKFSITPLTDEVEANIKKIQQEIIELEKAFYGKSNYEQLINREQQIMKKHDYTIKLTPEKEKELDLQIQQEIDHIISSDLQDDKNRKKQKVNSVISKDIEGKKLIELLNISKQIFLAEHIDYADVEQFMSLAETRLNFLTKKMSEKNSELSIIQEEIKSITELKEEMLRVYQEKNGIKESTNSEINHQQTSDLEEWKKVFSTYQEMLYAYIDSNTMQPEIIENIRKGNYSLNELLKIIPKEYVDIDIVYQPYINTISEFKEWVKENNISMTFEQLLQEIMQEENNKSQSSSMNR